MNDDVHENQVNCLLFSMLHDQKLIRVTSYSLLKAVIITH